MGAPAGRKLFLSHSHKDKRVARYLVRYLTAYGITVWLDERELRAGADLSASIRTHIQNADTVLVVASKASAVSDWVGRELEFAQQNGKSIVPFFMQPVAGHERFRNYLGIDATSPQDFADAVHRLIRDLFLSFHQEPPQADRTVLTSNLRELAREELDLEPLIGGCLDSKGLHRENMDSVFKASFLPLDYALNALFDLNPTRVMADHAAYGFCMAGAGVRALSLWIASTGDGEGSLVTAIGRPLNPELIPTAIRLLASCNPPNNHALYMFIDKNAPQLNEQQKRSVIQLVTWPVRDPSNLGDVLGWVAMRHFSGSGEIQQMWGRWVEMGAFDGKPCTPADLARYLRDAKKDELHGWAPIEAAVREYVRRCVRSGDKERVLVAVEHLRAAADHDAPGLAGLLTEMTTGTAEWDQWRERDRNTADSMQWYVMAFKDEATGNRDWHRAWQQWKETVALQEQADRVRENKEGRKAGA
jgi:hypothetical protein